MGGRLFIQDGHRASRWNVCVSGYCRGKENFALSNFEDNSGKGYHFNDPDLGLIHFPTAEHYLHFQKMNLIGKQMHLQAWQSEQSPGKILAGIRDSNSRYFIQPSQSAYMRSDPHGNKKFDGTRWDEDKVFVQMQINASKYYQSTAFQAAIHQSIGLGQAFADNAGPATIIEDTSSASKLEKEWGTGPDGLGKNILGNSQTAFARMLELGQVTLEKTPALLSFKTGAVSFHYNFAEIQYQTGLQITLIAVRALSGCDKGTNQIDTSALPEKFVKKIIGDINSLSTSPIKLGFYKDSIKKVANLPMDLSKSCFPIEQIQQIYKQINALEKEINSCWPYPNRSRKAAKIRGLEDLLHNSTTMDAKAAVSKTEKDHPEIRKGGISTRTADLLDEIRNTTGAHVIYGASVSGDN